MIRFNVEITQEALNDMEQIFEHIACVLLAPENAMAQYNRIADAILTLEYMPQRFRIMESEPAHSRGMRRVLVDNYSVFYIVQENRVVVTNVLYTPSDIEQRLNQP